MSYIINGGNKLFGEVKIQSAKNSVLCLIAASILSENGVFIHNCPKIYDVSCMTKILKKLGAKTSFIDDGLYLNCSNIKNCDLPEKLTREVRASLFMIGALLARYKKASILAPGGCNIGSRPMDIHLDALMKMGVKIREENGVIHFSVDKLAGNKIRFKYPSVGATENAIMAASLAEGVTLLENCAKEPEIVDLQNFLNLMGAKIVGAGSSSIRIEGVKRLGGVEYNPIPDRIEAGTFLLAVAGSGGELAIKGCKEQNISALIEKLSHNACKIYPNNDIIYIKVDNSINSFGEIITSPYPGFPTDLQPLAVATACVANGLTVVKETVFESRFRYAEELIKMGARITVNGNTLMVNGGALHGAKVFAPDLRGGASLCIAGLCAEGETIVEGINNIERGYEFFDRKLAMIGAKIISK